MINKIKSFFNKEIIHYTESIVYICSIIVVVIANIYGPVWVRMIPLLFVLGMIGKLAFDRPVITTLFGTIVSLCIVYLSGVTNVIDNVLMSFISALYIALGELFGWLIKKIYVIIIDDKKIDKKRLSVSITGALIIFIICTVFHNYTDSNIFTYNNCRNRLKRYLLLNYSNKHFEILDAKYDYSNENNFRFNVSEKDSNDNYRFIVYLNENLNIYDGIKESKILKEIAKMNETLNETFKNEFTNIQKDIINENGVWELNLNMNTTSTKNDEVTTFSKDVAKIISIVLNEKRLNNIEQVNISLIDTLDKKESKIATIYVNGYKKNIEEGIQKDYVYVMKALDVEFFD